MHHGLDDCPPVRLRPALAGAVRKDRLPNAATS
jgi:hypothetical protein